MNGPKFPNINFPRVRKQSRTEKVSHFSSTGFFFSFTRRPLLLTRSYTVQTVHSLNLVHLFINVFLPILYFFIHLRPTELNALVFGHLHSVLTRYLSDNSLSSVFGANKNLQNFVVRILMAFFQ